MPKRSLCCAAAAATLALALVVPAAHAGAAGAAACSALPVSASLSAADAAAFDVQPTALVTPSGAAKISGVRVQLLRGKRVFAAGTRAGALAKGRKTAVALRPLRSVTQGRYQLQTSGRLSGCDSSLSRASDVTLAPATRAPTPVAPATNVTDAVVDWSGGAWKGHEAAGFNAPGIGHGEIVCRPDAQYIRFYPDNLGDEVAMVNWTYRDWSQNHEKAVREALHAPGTGATFSEGLNKFGPYAEKHSTGEFDGIISDRGPFGAPSGGTLAPPTTLKLTWVWDFSQTGGESCHVQGAFTSQVTADPPPVVRSVQTVWRGDDNAAGHDAATVDVPGLGGLGVSCQSGVEGTRRLTVDAPAGGTVTTREGSDEHAVAFAPGPIVTELPNNGMVFVTFGGGQSLIASSRWKVNDPNGSKNSCAVAAQVARS